jgi:Tol biopolymer transport system component
MQTPQIRLHAVVLAALVGSAMFGAGCGGCGSDGDFIECDNDTDCRLEEDGRCIVNPATDHQFCAYPDEACPSGMRWSDLDVEDSISGMCVPIEVDAGVPDASVDGSIDAGIDAMPIDGGPTCGARVVFRDGASGAGEIYSANPDGSGITNLSNHTSEDTTPSWSPLNDRVAFESRRDGNSEIYVVNPNGTGLANLTQDAAAEDSRPVFSPNGLKIAWTKGLRLWVMDANGANKEEVSTLTVPYYNTISWSPDSTTIAVHAAGEIQLIPAAGGTATNITMTAQSESGPAWSPLGNKILFTTSTNEIVTVNLDGSGLLNLTNNAAMDTQGSWSPDGLTVTFNSDRDGNNEIYTVPAAGGAATRLTTNAGSDRAAVWSPGGDLIAFTRSVAGPSVSVVTMRPDGTMEESFSMSNVAGFVSWSPCP